MTRFLGTLLLGAAILHGQIKLLPPAGAPIAESDRAALTSDLNRLRASIAKLRTHPLLPDVLIFQEAVRYALTYNEFFRAGDVAKARALLGHGEARAAELATGRHSWTGVAGPGGARIRVEDRRLGATLRLGGSLQLLAHRAAPLAAGRVVPRARRDIERSGVPHRSDETAGRIHAARYDRAAPLRALLQRQPLRRGSGPVRGARRGAAGSTRSTRTAS